MMDVLALKFAHDSFFLPTNPAVFDTSCYNNFLPY